MPNIQRKSSRFRLAFPLLAGIPLAALMLAAPGRADAQVCASNSDCAAGTTCQQTSVPSAEPGCAGNGCPVRGSDGSAGKALVAPDAVAMTCAPAPCQSDADCGSQMVCHTETNSVCSGGAPTACGRDMKCEAPPTACTETKVSTCAYKWQQPCSADADCGDGFACEPSMITSCSGGSAGPVGAGTSGTVGTGAGTPTMGGAGGSPASTTASDAPADVTARPAPDGGTTEMCTTTTSFPGWCRPRATTCAADADCPAAWTCVDANVAGGGTSGGPTDVGSSGSGAGGAAPSTTTGDGTAPPTTLVARAKVCQSPVSFPVRGGIAIDVGAPKEPPSGGGGLTSGSGNGAAEAAAHGSNAGCTVAGQAGSPLAGFVALMLGLALAATRRGRRRGDRD